MSNYLILSLIFISAFLLVLLTLLFFRRMTSPTLRRLQRLSESEETKIAEGKKEKEKKEFVFGKALEDVSRLAMKDKKQTSKLRQSLIQAGYDSEKSVNIFLGWKIISTIIFFGVFFFLGLQVNRPLSLILTLSFVIALVGYSFPDMILNSRIRKRQEMIAGTLSDAIDLLVITVEAGLGINAAILKVGDDLTIRCPPLAKELAKVNRDIRTGSSREEALRSLSIRNNVEDLRIFVGALVMADRLGTSIADTLRAQADSLRTRIRQRAEEQAAKSGIKMLLPLVLCILPALITIVMGPGLIQVIRSFQ